MMNNPLQARHLVTGALLLCYLIPVVAFTTYAALWIPKHDRLQLLAAGIFGSMAGTLVVMLLMRRWELTLIEPTEQYYPQQPTASSADSSEEVEGLQQALRMSQELQDSLSMELQQQIDAQQHTAVEIQELKQLNERLEQSLSAQHERSVDLLSAKEAQILEYQQTIFDQQTQLEKREKQIISLETTARDLKYELKTLIDLTDRIRAKDEEIPEDPEPAPVPPVDETPPAWSLARGDSTHRVAFDPTVQLNRCINIAQKLTGARHLTGHTPRFQDMSVDGYALDLRRLCDSLRSESGCMILLYSLKEDKLLFVNDKVKELLGWAPEKFIQDFPHLLADARVEWTAALRQAASSSQPAIELPLKTRSGECRSLRCHLGMVPTGIFKTHVIAVMD